MGQVKKHSVAFRREVVSASYSDGGSIASVARRFGVSENALYAWRKAYRSTIQADIQDDPPSFIPVFIDADRAAMPDPAPSSDPPITRDTCRVSVHLGGDRRVEVEGVFPLCDLITFVRGVAA